MDTSIIVVIAIVVVFVIAVPTMIRRSANELERVEIDTVPDEAQVIAAEAQNPCRDHTERATVFHAESTVEPSVPRLDVAPLNEAPTLSLSAPMPEFSVIDGTSHASTGAEVAEQDQPATLPIAVGETRSSYLDGLSTSSHEPHSPRSSASGNVRLLHPAVHAVFNQSPGRQGPGADGTDPGRGRSGRLGEGSESMSRPLQQGLPGPGRSSRTPADELGGETHRRGTQFPHPISGAEEDHSMTEKATTLRESMKSLAAMTRAFALVLLASVLGILVTGVLAIFSIFHIALAGVFLGFAVGSLFMVRSLNLRRREIRAQLREVEGPAARKRSATEETPVSQAPAPVTVKQQTPARTATKPATTAAEAKTSGSKPAAPKPAVAPRAESKPAGLASAEFKQAGSTKAAQARAVMQRNASAKQNREEADTGEIPLVRIRKEEAEGHTTRQVLLTGPIPIVEEADTDSETVSSAPAEETTSAPAAETTADETAKTTSELTDNSPHEAAETKPAAKTETSGVTDPFMQRLKARDAWSPTPLPVPSYVAAPEVERTVPAATAADASSYEMEARSREDIAAEFAAELGYRAELSDSAREDSPLEHGRKAIRTTKKAPEMGAIDDVLARRRA